MKTMTNEMTRKSFAGWTKCRICKKNVYGNWWTKYKHCIGHASRCLPWEAIMGIAFGIWL